MAKRALQKGVKVLRDFDARENQEQGVFVLALSSFAG